jgi:hypothetical protein
MFNPPALDSDSLLESKVFSIGSTHYWILSCVAATLLLFESKDVYSESLL